MTNKTSIKKDVFENRKEKSLTKTKKYTFTKEIFSWSSIKYAKKNLQSKHTLYMYACMCVCVCVKL